MSWMRVLLTRDDVNAGKHIRLQDAFEQVFLTTVAPKEAAMFENDPSVDEYGYYFSPEAAEIFAATLDEFNASQCDAPPRAGTSLLVGHSDAWDLLSPDAKSDGI